MKACLNRNIFLFFFFFHSMCDFRGPHFQNSKQFPYLSTKFFLLRNVWDQKILSTPACFLLKQDILVMRLFNSLYPPGGWAMLTPMNLWVFEGSDGWPRPTCQPSLWWSTLYLLLQNSGKNLEEPIYKIDKHCHNLNRYYVLYEIDDLVSNQLLLQGEVFVQNGEFQYNTLEWRISVYHSKVATLRPTQDSLGQIVQGQVTSNLT